MTIDNFPESLSRVLTVASGKGGVCKTTLTANIASLAAATGLAVLVIDFDPQGDIQDDLGYFSDERLDAGHHLATSIVNGTPLQPVLTGVRTHDNGGQLDVIPGGEYLKDVRRFLARMDKQDLSILPRILAPLAEQYDLILLDTPPNDEEMQMLTFAASRWIMVSTTPDSSSIRAIANVRQAQLEVIEANPTVEMIGVVLVGVPTSAHAVRRSAQADIRAVLGDEIPLFDRVIREATAAAVHTRKQGVVAHELAAEVEGAESYWAALKAGRKPQRLPGSTPALADDYVLVVDELLRRVGEQESAQGKAGEVATA